MRTATIAFAALAAAVVSSTAHAQRRHRPADPPAGATASPAPESPQEAAARQHFERGLALVEQARWADAVVELEQARALAAVPPVLYNLGVAHRALGHDLAAIEAFGAYLAATTDNPANSARRAEVEAFSRELQAAVGHVQFEITPAGAFVLVDGNAPPAGSRTVDVDPGTHVVAITAPRFRARQERVRVPAGGTITVNVSLERADVIQTGPPIAPIAVMGVGVLGLAAGVVFAIVRGSAFGTFERQHCNPPEQGVIRCEPVPLNPTDNAPTDPNYRLGVTMGYASLASFIAGGVVLAGGAAWFVISMRTRGNQERAASGAVSIVPVLAPGYAGIAGRF